MARLKEKEARAGVQVEVPRAALLEVAGLTWGQLVELAEAAGWRMRTTAETGWCAADHVLLREGYDRMHGIPVVLFQRW